MLKGKCVKSMRIQLKKGFLIGLVICGMFCEQSLYAFELDPTLVDNDKILLNLNNADLKIKVGDKNQIILQQGSFQEKFSSEKKEGLLRITQNLFEKEKLNIELTLKPHLFLEVHQKEGAITATKLLKETYLNLSKGKISISSSSAPLNLHQLRGEVNLKDQTGKTFVDSYSANITVENISADLEIQNFSGNSIVENSKSDFTAFQNQGLLKIVNHQGSLNFDLNKAQLNAQKISGRIDGQSSEGVINLIPNDDVDINVRLKSGKLNIQSGQMTGGSLNVSTTDGDIYLPNPIKTNGAKSFRGRFGNANSKASIFARSQDAIIQIK